MASVSYRRSRLALRLTDAARWPVFAMHCAATLLESPICVADTQLCPLGAAMLQDRRVPHALLSLTLKAKMVLSSSFCFHTPVNPRFRSLPCCHDVCTYAQVHAFVVYCIQDLTRPRHTRLESALKVTLVRCLRVGGTIPRDCCQLRVRHSVLRLST